MLCAFQPYTCSAVKTVIKCLFLYTQCCSNTMLCSSLFIDRIARITWTFNFSTYNKQDLANLLTEGAVFHFASPGVERSGRHTGDLIWLCG